MSRQDPGAATGAGIYPADPDCVCDHAMTVHAIGARGRRTSCSASGCRCTTYTERKASRG